MDELARAGPALSASGDANGRHTAALDASLLTFTVAVSCGTFTNEAVSVIDNEPLALASHPLLMDELARSTWVLPG
jgi:hypothetical protein